MWSFVLLLSLFTSCWASELEGSFRDPLGILGILGIFYFVEQNIQLLWKIWESSNLSYTCIYQCIKRITDNFTNKLCSLWSIQVRINYVQFHDGLVKSDLNLFWREGFQLSNGMLGFRWESILTKKCLKEMKDQFVTKWQCWLTFSFFTFFSRKTTIWLNPISIFFEEESLSFQMVCLDFDESQY